MALVAGLVEYLTQNWKQYYRSLIGESMCTSSFITLFIFNIAFVVLVLLRFSDSLKRAIAQINGDIDKIKKEQTEASKTHSRLKLNNDFTDIIRPIVHIFNITLGSLWLIALILFVILLQYYRVKLSNGGSKSPKIRLVDYLLLNMRKIPYVSIKWIFLLFWSIAPELGHGLDRKSPLFRI